MSNNGFIKLNHEAIEALKGKHEALNLYVIMLKHTAYKGYVNKKGVTVAPGECCLTLQEMSELMLYRNNEKGSIKNISKIRRLLEVLYATRLCEKNTFICRHKKTTLYKMHEKPYTAHIKEGQEVSLSAQENDQEKPLCVDTRTDNYKSLDRKIDFKHLEEEDDDSAHAPARITFFDTFYTSYGKMLTPLQIGVLNEFMAEGLTDKQISESIRKAAQVTGNINYLYAILKNLLNPSIEQEKKGKNLKGAIGHENGGGYVEGFNW